MFHIFWRLSYDFCAGNKFDYVIQDMQGVMPSSDNVKSWQISEKLLLPTATCYTLGLLNMVSVKLYAHRGWGVLSHWHTVGMIPVASRPGCSPNASCSPVFTLGLLHTHTHTFNAPLSGTTQVSQYQKGKTNLGFTKARDSEWQWHQLGRMQVCTSLQTDKWDNYASTPPLSFYRPDALPVTYLTASKHWRRTSFTQCICYVN